MEYKNILLTGGAGFVGSNLSIKLKEHYSNINVIALDNLKRRGSELNIPRLKKHDVQFVHGDIRNKEDLEFDTKIDLIIDCSAEPSVLAGVNSSPEYVINTNLVGTMHCLEVARKHKSDFIFLSTSRVYPIEKQNKLKFKEEKTRFVLSDNQKIKGASAKGIAEDFPMGRYRSFYGATKLCSEHLIHEYREVYGVRSIINRCGVIAGPWQMGKVDQGVLGLWVARHFFKKPLTYIGFGGKGKQVRDFVHVDDLFDLIFLQLEKMEELNGETFNIGGGLKGSASLVELTNYCREITGNKISIKGDKNDRVGDVRIYISDIRKAKKLLKWKPKSNVEDILEDVYSWMVENESDLVSILR